MTFLGAAPDRRKIVLERSLQSAITVNQHLRAGFRLGWPATARRGSDDHGRLRDVLGSPEAEAELVPVDPGRVTRGGHAS
ncbi:MAG: hypothetical protein ACYCXW_19215 [Solirubrobacteraceae bacterium]